MMESDRIEIRESRFSDCQLFYEWERQPYIMESFTMSKDRDYEAVVQEFFLRSQERDKRQFTIVLREEERPIGRIFISRIDPVCDSLDITRIYIGDPELLGKGYGKEALLLIMEYCFINLHMERLTLDHLVNNTRAAALYQNIGFQYEGIMRHGGKKDGRYVDLHLMSMLRAEFFEKCDRQR